MTAAGLPNGAQSYEPMAIEEISAKIRAIENEIRKVIIGQKMAGPILFSLIGLFLPTDREDKTCHVLLEGGVGTAKTLLAKTIARTIDGVFSRIQLTPDLLPADITGANILDLKTHDVAFRNGPLFANIVLADELNRASSKTQSALLEAMSSGTVSYDGVEHALPEPFIVFATQNPIDQEGTYRLAEAQKDRFIVKINVEYPELEDEIAMLKLKLNSAIDDIEVRHVITPQEVMRIRYNISRFVHIDRDIFDRVGALIQATRPEQSANVALLKEQDIHYGASPRAGIYLLRAAKVHAAYNGHDSVHYEDIFKCAYNVLRHRIFFDRSVQTTEQVENRLTELLQELYRDIFHQPLSTEEIRGIAVL